MLIWYGDNYTAHSSEAGMRGGNHVDGYVCGVSVTRERMLRDR